MKLTVSNKNFGYTIGVFFLILFIYFFSQNQIYSSLIICSFFFLFFGFLNSKILTPFNIIWIKFGEILGVIVGPIVMFMIYFFIAYPTNIVMKILGKDILNLKLNKKRDTYWVKEKKQPYSMDNQF